MKSKKNHVLLKKDLQITQEDRINVFYSSTTMCRSNCGSQYEHTDLPKNAAILETRKRAYFQLL
jgi:hypothetical protein